MGKTMTDKIIQVDRTIKPVWNRRNLKGAWNTGTRGFVLNAMGTDHFPIDIARELGFVVKSLPDYCSKEVANHGFKMLQTLAIKVGYARPLYSCTCLIIGSEGNIGKEVHKEAKKKGLDVLTHDIVLGDTDKQLKKKLGKSKIIFLCIPLNDQTKYFYNENKIIASLKKKPFIINVSGRNGLVNTVQVSRALNTDKLEGYAVDEEQTDYRFKYNGKVFATPHVGWKSKESVVLRKRFLREAHESLKSILV